MARPHVMTDLKTCVALGTPRAPLIFPIFEELLTRLAGVIGENKPC